MFSPQDNKQVRHEKEKRKNRSPMRVTSYNYDEISNELDFNDTNVEYTHRVLTQKQGFTNLISTLVIKAGTGKFLTKKSAPYANITQKDDRRELHTESFKTGHITSNFDILESTSNATWKGPMASQQFRDNDSNCYHNDKLIKAEGTRRDSRTMNMFLGLQSADSISKSSKTDGIALNNCTNPTPQEEYFQVMGRVIKNNVLSPRSTKILEILLDRYRSKKTSHSRRPLAIANHERTALIEEGADNGTGKRRELFRAKNNNQKSFGSDEGQWMLRSRALPTNKLASSMSAHVSCEIPTASRELFLESRFYVSLASISQELDNERGTVNENQKDDPNSAQKANIIDEDLVERNFVSFVTRTPKIDAKEARVVDEKILREIHARTLLPIDHFMDVDTFTIQAPFSDFSFHNSQETITCRMHDAVQSKVEEEKDIWLVRSSVTIISSEQEIFASRESASTQEIQDKVVDCRKSEVTTDHWAEETFDKDSRKDDLDKHIMEEIYQIIGIVEGIVVPANLPKTETIRNLNLKDAEVSGCISSSPSDQMADCTIDIFRQECRNGESEISKSDKKTQTEDNTIEVESQNGIDISNVGYRRSTLNVAMKKKHLFKLEKNSLQREEGDREENSFRTGIDDDDVEHIVINILQDILRKREVTFSRSRLSTTNRIPYKYEHEKLIEVIDMQEKDKDAIFTETFSTLSNVPLRSKTDVQDALVSTSLVDEGLEKMANLSCAIMNCDLSKPISISNLKLFREKAVERQMDNVVNDALLTCEKEYKHLDYECRDIDNNSAYCNAVAERPLFTRIVDYVFPLTITFFIRGRTVKAKVKIKNLKGSCVFNLLSVYIYVFITNLFINTVIGIVFS